MKWLFVTFGGLCTISGFMIFWLPIPVGLPLMLAGVAILVRHSRRSRRLAVRLLRHYPRARNKFRSRKPD